MPLSTPQAPTVDGLDTLRALARALPVAVAVVVTLGAAVAGGGDILDQSALGRTLVATLHLDSESGIGTWFASAVLLGAALLMWHHGRGLRRAGSPDALPWLLLALGCAFLSMDESVGLHERLGNAAARALPVGALGTFAWIIPGAAVVVAGGIGFRRFLWRQSTALRHRLLLAGSVYFGGALGCEAIGSALFLRFGRQSWPFQTEVVVEEGLEMLGAVLLVRTIVDVLCTARATTPTQALPMPPTASRQLASRD